MRTYWLHSVWVLGFFLSLFSLQGRGSLQRPRAPPLAAVGSRMPGGVTGTLGLHRIRLIGKSGDALFPLVLVQAGSQGKQEPADLLQYPCWR